MKEIPEVDLYFVESEKTPTVLGESRLPPAGASVVNTIHKS